MNRRLLTTLLFFVILTAFSLFSKSGIMSNKLLNRVFIVNAQTQPPSSEWYMAGANPQRTSWVAEEVDHASNIDWYRSFDAYIPTKVQPIAANGAIYISTSRGLYSISATTGNRNWVFATDLPLGNAPTYNSGVLYVGGFDRNLYAINENGSLKWKFSGATAGYDTNPLVVDNTVYLGNRDGWFYAVNTSDGSLKWKYQTGGQIHFSAAINIAKTTVFFASDDSYAYALNATTINPNGELVWKSAKLPGSGFHSWWPVIVGNAVVFGSSRNYRSEIAPFGSGAIFDLPFSPPSAGNSSLFGTQTGNRMTLENVAGYLKNPGDNGEHRDFLFFDQGSGAEMKFDLDGSGTLAYAPLLNWGTHSGSRYPIIVNPNNQIFVNNSWNNSTDYLNSMTSWSMGDKFITIYDIGGGLTADEPMAYSLAGNTLYFNLCCDRWSGAFNISNPADTKMQFYGYPPNTLPRLAPLYTSKLSGFGFTNKTEDHAILTFGDVNGLYGYHGDQSPPVPYNGRVYMIRGNSLFAFADIPRKSIDPFIGNEPIPSTSISAVQPDANTLRNKLDNEIQKMLDAGHLRPGYTPHALWQGQMQTVDGDNFVDYFHDPSDTIISLLQALPYIPASKQANLRAYIQNEFNNFNPINVRHIGWWGGVREAFQTPKEVSDLIPTSVTLPFSNGPSDYTSSYPGWTRSPMFMYAVWKYVAAGLGDISLFNSASSAFGTPPSTSVLAKYPEAANAWLAGLKGFIELDKLGDGDVDNVIRQNQYDTLLNWRKSNFQTAVTDGPVLPVDDNTPGKNPIQSFATAKNFMFLVPEIAVELSNDAAAKVKVQAALSKYELMTPYWMATRFEATYNEGVYQNLYDTGALFQAYARIMNMPASQLLLRLDAPAFARGDLFYIQNLVSVIEASSNIPNTTPTPTPVVGLQIGSINVESLSTIPRYSKFEVSFPITNSQATNMYFPYDTNTPAGVAGGTGISVDILLTNPSGVTKTQPCFYYQPVQRLGSGGSSGLVPTGSADWRCRVAPDTVGTWQYQIRATDKGGTNTSSQKTFSVVNGTSKGFIQASKTDTRFFEFSDGTPFITPLINTPLASTFQTLSDIVTRVPALAQNGVHFIRWFPTAETGGVMPYGDNLRSSWAYGNSTSYFGNPDSSTGKIFSFRPYYYSSQSIPSLANATYRLTIRASVTGEQVIRAFINDSYIDLCSSTNTQHSTCYAQSKQVGGWNTWAINYQNGNSSDNLNVGMRGLYISTDAPSPFNQVRSGSIGVNSITLQRNEAGTWGPNLIARGDADSYAYVDQPNAAKLDEVLSMSEIYGLYHKLTLLHKNDEILDRIQTNGDITNAYDPNNFYLSIPARWYEDVYTRYFVARWSYSTSLHSLELANENDPGSSVTAIQVANLVNSLSARHILMSNSYWHWVGLPVSAWTDSSMDFVDRHWYTQTSGGGGPTSIYSSNYLDSVAYGRDCNSFFKSYSKENSINKPFVQGEGGNMTAGYAGNTAIESDTTGTWYHKKLWTNIGTLGYSCDGEWWPNYNLMYPMFKAYEMFMKDEPLNNGTHVEIGTDLGGTNAITSTDSTLRAFGSKDPTTSRVLLWVDNSNDTWQNAGKAASATSIFTIDATGLPEGSYTMEVWDTKDGTHTTTPDATKVTDGKLEFSVTNLSTDSAYKFYNSSLPTNTPTPTIDPVGGLVSSTPTQTPTPIPTVVVTSTPTVTLSPTSTVIPTATLTPTPTSSQTQSLYIFDHSSVDQLGSIPNSYINAASNIKFMFRHASVGGNIDEGLNTLQSQNSIYNRTNWNFQWRGNPGWQAKVDDFATQVPLQLNSFDVFSMKFCYIDPDADWAYYRDHMLQLESAYPTKKFVWWTIPLTTTGDTRFDTFNSQVRNYAKANNKILFDLADIESGGVKNSNGNEILNQSYTSDGGHLNSAGSLRVARAFWVMMANIAGYQKPIATLTPTLFATNTPALTATPTSGPTNTTTPTLSPTPTPIPGDANNDRLVNGLDYVVWLNHYNQSVSGGRSVGDFDDSTKVDGVDYIIWLNNYR